jgi:hypothetical protein
MLSQNPGIRDRASALAGAFALLMLVTGNSDEAQSQERAALAPQELQLVTKAALSDARVRGLLGPGEPTVVSTDPTLDKSMADAFLSDEAAKRPQRQASVLLWNRKSGKAARALIQIPEGKVVQATPVATRDVPLLESEIEEALELVKGKESFKRAAGVDISRFHVEESGSGSRAPYVAQALPVRGTLPTDPCTEDRCLDLIFRVEEGYLPLRAQVNLTRRSVELAGQSGQGAHHE